MQTLATLTEQQAREAPAGPETDALVAEAMGWTQCDVVRDWDNINKPVGVPPGGLSENSIAKQLIGPYTTDRNAAAEATMAVEHDYLKLTEDYGRPAWAAWLCRLRLGDDGRPLVHATAPAEPLARCRAVLLAAVIRREQKK